MTNDREAIARDLRALLKGDVEFDPITRRLYATDAGLSQIEPLGVVCPRDTEDVARLVAYAAEHGLPLVPRGMGSGLNGGAVGAGIQVDFTRYMNAILEVSPEEGWVRVQPGVVKAVLDRYLQPYGVFFAPDPSSENHCSLGGMIATNSSGPRTVAYGTTKDHVLALEVVLADGSVFQARPYALEEPSLAEFLAAGDTASRAFAVVLPRLIAEYEELMASMPNVVKNSCGYRIEAVLDTGVPGQTAVASIQTGTTCLAAPKQKPKTAHLQRLFVGSEGTLGLVTEATLKVVPLPAQRGIAMAYFPSVFAVGEAVPGILALGPTAVEIMDSRFLSLVKQHDPRFGALVPDRTDTAILIEFEGASDDELDEKFAALQRHLESTAALSLARAMTAAETEYLWRIRRTAVAIIQRNPGPKQPLPFMEDIAIHPTQLPASIDFIQRLFDREGVEAIFVGHVGDGNIHTRPVLDIKDPHDRAIVRRIYDEVSAHVLTLRGTMAGEHGDGLIHTPRLREMYGDKIYDFFVQIKNAFDPQGILNPGKKVGPQGEADLLFQNIRYGPDYRTLPQKPRLRFAERGYETEIERCHGCAACKSQVVTTMCPMYKATRREHASPRAKANLLRAVITGALLPAQADNPVSPEAAEAAEAIYGSAVLKAVTDYCIECGMCAVECPSAVNIPKLMLEAKTRYREKHPAAVLGSPRTRAEVILSRAETLSRLGSLLAPVANPLLENAALRRLGEPILGIDRRRSMPRFARPSYAAVRRQKREATAEAQGVERSDLLVTGSERADAERTGSSPTVAYFYDMYANYNQPELALIVEQVLAAHGVRVITPAQRASGIPEMLYGYAKRAAKVARKNLRSLRPYVEAGALVVSAEPTASFALKKHYADYLEENECAAVAQATRDLGEFLLAWRREHPDLVPPVQPLKKATTESTRTVLRVAYHQPCHLKAQEVGSPGLELLREIPGIEVIDLASGCCGMAGTFGMKVGTYDLSLRAGQPLFERVSQVAPDLIATECSTCRMQLAEATGVKCLHPVVLLAQAYGIAPPSPAS